MSIPRPLAALVALVLIIATACSPSSASTAPSGAAGSSSPGASAAKCQTAPAISSAPAGWGTQPSASTLFPLIISSRVVCGGARIVFSFLDAQSNPVAAPDRTATVAFYDLAKDPANPVVTVPGTFAWAIEGSRGIYVLDANLPEAGTWGAEFRTSAPGSPEQAVRVVFDVADSTPTVTVGQQAPASKTPTLADVGGDVAKISTDTKPDPAFYQTSVADALAAHKPFVLVFATPKFCTSQQCGPTLDDLKPLAAANPAITFINVEPYILQVSSGQLQPVLDAQGNLQATPTTQQWGLLTEPWIFAVDSQGVVRESYELIATAAEMTAAIKAITPAG